MRQIIKQPLDIVIEKQLQQKQAKINEGRANPKWKLTPTQRMEITAKLLASQKYLCCYCECTIDANDVHIEHFFERSECPKLIYDYTENLLLSCEGDRQKVNIPETPQEEAKRKANISCGHKKGKTYHNEIAVDYDLLLNPMNDNSSLLLYNEDGNIESRSENPAKIDQVIYTKNRLNIKSTKLANNRVDKIEEVFIQLNDIETSEQKQFITSLLDETKDKLPSYFSTIKDNFGFILVN